MATSLLDSMAALLVVPDEQGRNVSLLRKTEDLTINARASGVMAKQLEPLAAAFEAYFGHAFGEPVWHGWLVSQLEAVAQRREKTRLQQAHGDPDPLPDLLTKIGQRGGGLVDSGAVYGDTTGASILRYLQTAMADGGYGPLPAGLTEAAIDELIERVGLGRGGRGGKKTPRRVVSEFLAILHKKH